MLKEIREHYGIPQSFFADYLGITRSHLSMAESGRRYIPSQITLRLLPLYTAISQPALKSNDEKLGRELGLQKEALNKLSNFRIKENEYKLPLIEKRLAKIKADHARCVLILENMNALKAAAKPIDLGLLTLIEINARQLQKKSGENCQLKLQLQIQHLQAEILYLKNLSK
jgi:transcriptional regulator with XRE-family HTH domain